MSSSRAFYPKSGTTAGTFAAGNHHHAGSDVDSGTVAYTRLPVGTASSTVAAADDPRIMWGHYCDPVAAGGLVVPHRRQLTSHSVASIASGVVHMSTFVAPRSEAITTVTAYTGGTAAAATPTLCRYGLWTVAANNTITLVGSTTNDTTLFASTFTTYARTLSATVNLVAGQLYAVGLLIVTGAAMPAFHGAQLPSTGIYQTIAALNPPSSFHLASQTDLPTGVTPIGSTVSFMFRLS